jgi:phosphoglucosamine mutase
MLGDRGRLVIRASGTEPVIRVMAEADAVSMVDDAVAMVAQAVQSAA